MSMLDLITKASAHKSDQLSVDSEYPIVVDPDPILLNLKQKSNDVSFLKPVQGWEFSQIDTDIIELGQKMYNYLKVKAKNPKSFNKNELLSMLNSYLKKNMKKNNISIGVNAEDEAYTKLLIQKVRFLKGDAVLGLVLDSCLGFEIWEILEALIVGGLVDGSCSKNLVCNLIERKRADLVCLCVKHVSDLQVFDIMSVLKFFLSPPKDAYAYMNAVRKEWENLTISAIETTNERVSAKVLLTIAYDDFTTSELCLHYLLASPDIDDVIFSACIGKLNGVEIMGLVRYLNKWLGKYQKFPQVCSRPKASSEHGLKAFESVPSLERVTKCFGLVIDQHFFSLVMFPEFREELKTMELVVNSLASEASVCCSLAKLAASLM